MGLEALDDTIGPDNRGYSEDQDPDENISVHSRLRTSKVVQDLTSSPRETRSSPASSAKISGQKPVRTSYKNIDMDIVEVTVDMESQFGVEQRLVHIMNKLAGQAWEPPSEESELLECADDTTSEDSPSSVKRKKLRDLTFVIPSRRCLQKKLEDAALMNF